MKAALGVLVELSQEIFRTGSPALPRRISLKAVVGLLTIGSYVPHDFQRKDFLCNEILVDFALLPPCRLCSTAKAIVGQCAGAKEKAAVIRDAVRVK